MIWAGTGRIHSLSTLLFVLYELHTMLRSLYKNNFLMSKSVWHLINDKLLSSTAKQKLLLKWDSVVRLFYIITGRSHFIKNKHGLKYLLDVNNLIDLRIAARGSYEAEQQAFFLEQIQKKHCSIFCDIGANWGMYSLTAAALKEVSSVLAFEPDNKNRSQLHANIFLNQFQETIKVYSCAVSSFTGEANFSATHDTDKLQNRGTAKLSDAGEVSVQVKQLDDILSVNGQKIALKIDIEGNELEALKGMQNCLKNNHCILQIEAFKNTKDLVMQQMKMNNYNLLHTIGNDYYFSNFQ